MNNHRKTCYDKTAFASRKAAEKSGQRAYKCEVCHFWHRAGQILPIRNPVLRTNPIYEQPETTN
jgi:hypothetical protein